MLEPLTQPKHVNLTFIIYYINEVYFFQTILKVMTNGEEHGKGILLIHGPQNIVKEIAPK